MASFTNLRRPQFSSFRPPDHERAFPRVDLSLSFCKVSGPTLFELIKASLLRARARAIRSTTVVLWQ
jgi:hypothetical protein